MKKIFITLVGVVISISPVFAANYYVSTNGNDSHDGTSWATAKKTIQAGVNVASIGDTVWVTNGTWVLSNQIVVNNEITVRSVNGPTETIVNGNGQITLSRCFYLESNCTLNGFTVTNGYGNNVNGGGVFCVSTNTVITNCVITGNEVSQNHYGGGVYAGTLNNCMLSYNKATIGGGGGGACNGTLNNCILSRNAADWVSGGGAAGCTLNNCVISSNVAWAGGGAANSTLNNCTISGNSADLYGGGTMNCTLNNCTIVGNVRANQGSGVWGGTLNNCIVFYNNPAPQCSSYSVMRYTCASEAPAGNGNVTSEPMFVDKDSGNYRLAAGSPCINAGNNVYAPINSSLVDLDGNLRIWNVTVDIGAYEYGSVPPSSIGPMIKANGSTDDITINSGDNLSITVQIELGPYSGTNADWWVVALASGSWYYFNSALQWTSFDGVLSNCHPVYQGAIFDLPAAEVLNMAGLTVGSYTFWFAIDYPMDGVLDINGQFLVDSVNVVVQ